MEGLALEGGLGVKEMGHSVYEVAHLLVHVVGKLLDSASSGRARPANPARAAASSAHRAARIAPLLCSPLEGRGSCILLTSWVIEFWN